MVGKAFGDRERDTRRRAQRTRGEGEDVHLVRNKCMKLGRVRREKKPKMVLGSRGSHPQDPAYQKKIYKGHATFHLRQACDLRREKVCSHRRGGDAVKYSIGLFLVVHR